MATFKKKVNVSRIVLFAAIPMVLAALVLTGFFTFRRTLARFSLDFYYPFYQAAKHVELGAARQALAMQPRQKLASAVEQLQRQNAMLAAQVQRLREMEADNERLRQELRMPRWSDYREIYAEVILRDPATWNEQFVISKGLNDGIETGDLVLSFEFAPERVSGGIRRERHADRQRRILHDRAGVASAAEEQVRHRRDGPHERVFRTHPARHLRRLSDRRSGRRQPRGRGA